MRRSTGSTRLVGPVSAALSLAASVSLALAPGAGAAGPRHLPNFDLLVRPTTVSKLPATLRIGFEGFGEHRHEHGRKVRVGRVRLPEGTFTAVGNHRWICANFTPKGEPKLSGAGGCAPFAQALRAGLVDICADDSGALRIDGLVPNGVATIALDRDDPGPVRIVPVVRNAFTAPIPRADLTFRALDASGEALIEHRYPLADAGRGACFLFSEATAEAGSA